MTKNKKIKIHKEAINFQPGDAVIFNTDRLLVYRHERREKEKAVGLLIKRVKSGHNIAWHLLQEDRLKIVWEDQILDRL